MPYRSTLRVVGVTVIVLSLAALAGLLALLTSRRTTQIPSFGVLNAQSQYIAKDTAAGIRLATINIGWNDWEPRRGFFDGGYASQQAAKVARYRAAGWTVAVDLGLQYSPPWVLDMANGQLTDQDGSNSGTPNFEFSQPVRSAASAYIGMVVRSLGPVTYYRIGLSAAGEMLYPEAPNNQWWAFDAVAQGRAQGLPFGVGVDPLPGWVPGAATWDAQPVTPPMAQAWYDWYFGALVNAHTWEIETLRRSGYAGKLEFVMPGTGALPDVYEDRLAADLAPKGYDPAHTMNTAAVWWRDLSELPLTGVVVDISSVGDESGLPEGNGCEAWDSSVDYMSAPETILGWSDTRWLTYLARRHGLSVVGENPGNTRAVDLPTIMHLAQSCRLQSLQWAWDDQLEQGGGLATLSDYSNALRRERADATGGTPGTDDTSQGPSRA